MKVYESGRIITPVSEIRFEVKLYIAVSYFHENFGPQVAEIYPPIGSGEQSDLFGILTNLLDIVSVQQGGRKYFLFADEDFTSQNVLIPVHNEEARGGVTDFLISLIIRPNFPHTTAAISMDWTPFYSLEEQLLPSLENYIRRSTDGSDITEVLELIYTVIQGTIAYNLESLSPASYKIT